MIAEDVVRRLALARCRAVGLSNVTITVMSDHGFRTIVQLRVAQADQWFAVTRAFDTNLLATAVWREEWWLGPQLQAMVEELAVGLDAISTEDLVVIRS